MVRLITISFILFHFLVLGNTEASENSPALGRELLLKRVRRQAMAADLGERCDDPLKDCTAGNGGENAVCESSEAEDFDICQCADGTRSSPECRDDLCEEPSECPETSVCNVVCSPPCEPRPCNPGDCPAPLECNNNICEQPCTFGTNGVLRKRRSVGTTIRLTCSESDGQRCSKDSNARCMSGLCECISGTTLIDGLCITDGTVGGRCDGAGRDTCSNDRLAECKNPGTDDCICECKGGTSKRDGCCKTDGTARGKCDFNNDMCTKDKNAECKHPRSDNSFCDCKPGTSLYSGMCITDGACNGRCDGVGDRPCSKEYNAVCVNGWCTCKDGFSKVEGSCVQHGAPGGRCRDGLCDDVNSECVDNICVCQPGSSKQEGSCVPDGMPGGNCTSQGKCPDDMQSGCNEEHYCRCNMGTLKIGRVCEGDGLYGGRCQFGECYGRYAVCDQETYTCRCRSGCVPLYGHCIDIEYMNYLQNRTRPNSRSKSRSNGRSKKKYRK